MLSDQIITGLVLAITAHADLVDSVEHIMKRKLRLVNKTIHANGASMFLAVYIHIFRSLFYGSYKSPREII